LQHQQVILLFFLYITSNNFHLLNVHANFFSNLYIFTSTSIIFLYHWCLYFRYIYIYIYIHFLLNISSFITNMHIFQKFHCQHNRNRFTLSMPHDVSLIGHAWQMATIVHFMSMPKNVKIIYLHLHIHHNSLPLVFTYPLCTHRLLMKHILFHSQYMHIFQTCFSMPWWKFPSWFIVILHIITMVCN
jgi:hypothetical protein